jgi:hypothetical protein
MPVIITNKHVVAGADSLSAVIPIAPKGGHWKSDGSQEGELSFPLNIIGLQQYIIEHPDADVDLCAIPIAYLFEEGTLPNGFVPKLTLLDKNWRIPEDDVQYLRPIEQIVMIGYPNGLWDEFNNRPIARKGLTASHAMMKWNGQRRFVIDAACFPGSSGSPVFLYEDGIYRSGNGMAPGTQSRLIGTLFAGPLFSAEGRIEVKEIPTAAIAVPVTDMMMNLGFVVHADAIDDIHQVMRAREQARAAATKVPDYRRKF